jgi:hypothetical protein
MDDIHQTMEQLIEIKDKTEKPKGVQIGRIKR